MDQVRGSDGYIGPRWSPDGRFIVAMRARDQELQLFDWTKERWERLADIRSGYLNWSADGKWVYFAGHDTPHAIYRLNIFSRKVEQVGDLARVQQGPFFLGTWVGLAPGDAPLAVRNLTIEDIGGWYFEAR
jgi:hypothetical protein